MQRGVAYELRRRHKKAESYARLFYLYILYFYTHLSLQCTLFLLCPPPCAYYAPLFLLAGLLGFDAPLFLLAGLLGFDALCGVRYTHQAFLGDKLSGGLTDAVGLILDTHQRQLEIADKLALVGNQTTCLLL